jgi:hypothetical protein
MRTSRSSEKRTVPNSVHESTSRPVRTIARAPLATLADDQLFEQFGARRTGLAADLDACQAWHAANADASPARFDHECLEPGRIDVEIACGTVRAVIGPRRRRQQ